MKEIDNNTSQDSLAATNISFLLSFEKWNGSNDFLNLINTQITSIKKVLYFRYRSSTKSHQSKKNSLHT